MMKLLIAMLAFAGISSIVVAQDIKFSSVPNTVTVNSVLVRSVGNNGNDWRTGLAFPVLSMRNGRTEGYPTIADVSVWTLTDAKDFRRFFLGGGASLPLLERKHMRLDLTGGWSADFSNLEHPMDGRWGVGIGLTVRF